MSGIFLPFISDPCKHLIKLITQPNYRTYHWLITRFRGYPRYKPFHIRINGYQIHVPDSKSLFSSYKAIFLNQIYNFAFDGDAPKILDLGANIGLSVLYFKSRFPDAEITALEADPNIYGYLVTNLASNNITKVKCLNVAAWDSNAVLPFIQEGADAGKLSENDATGDILVQAIDIREILSQQLYDFIKIDIEGAEKVVLPACKEYLSNVQYVFVEYHAIARQREGLVDLLKVLSDTGFYIRIQEIGDNPSPFLKYVIRPGGYSYQANIFAWRE